MDIIINTINETVEFLFVGSLDTNSAPEAETSVNKVIENAPSKIVFNLEKTSFVSSAGLRVFLITAKKVAASGGVFKLCCANEVVKDVLEISGFVTFLDLVDTLEEALET